MGECQPEAMMEGRQEAVMSSATFVIDQMQRQNCDILKDWARVQSRLASDMAHIRATTPFCVSLAASKCQSPDRTTQPVHRSGRECHASATCKSHNTPFTFQPACPSSRPTLRDGLQSCESLRRNVYLVLIICYIPANDRWSDSLRCFQQ